MGASSSHRGSDRSVILLGRDGVGRKALVRREVKGWFGENPSGRLEDTPAKMVRIEGESFRVNFILSQSKTFETMRLLCLNYASGYLLCYAINDRESFDELQNKIEELMRVRDMSRDELRAVPMVFIATKADLDDFQVPNDEALNLALDLGAPLFFTSAKSDEQVSAAFAELYKRLAAKPRATSSSNVVHRKD